MFYFFSFLIVVDSCIMESIEQQTGDNLIEGSIELNHNENVAELPYCAGNSLLGHPSEDISQSVIPEDVFSSNNGLDTFNEAGDSEEENIEEDSVFEIIKQANISMQQIELEIENPTKNQTT